MSIEIKHNKPHSDFSLGGASFSTDAKATDSRHISANAENNRHQRRPIDIYVSSDDLRTTISFSIDEAEALVACLTHAISLRRQAEATQAA